MPDTILITRPEPGASETAARIAAMGLTPILSPVMAIRATNVRLPSPDRIAAILLASGNAVTPFPAAFRSRPVLTVGDATARRARVAGFSDVTSAAADAMALAALVRSRVQPGDGTLLLAAGRGQSIALATALRAGGYRVARRVVYEAAPVPELPEAAAWALARAPNDGRSCTVLFFSTETARCFMRLVRVARLEHTLPHCQAVTIGRPAAMALEGAGWSRVRVASRPNQDEMLSLLK